MTREEAIGKAYGMSGTKEQHEALEFLIPEVRELREFYERQSDDEGIRKWIIDELKDSLHEIETMYSGDYDNRDEQGKERRQAYLNKAIAYLENQKPSFRQIHDGVMWNSGLRTGMELEKQELEKQEECLADNSKTSASEDERIKNWYLEYLYDSLRTSDEQFKDQLESEIAWFEKQKEKLGDMFTVLLIKKEIERRIKTWQESRRKAIAMECNTLADDAAVRIEELYSLYSFLGTIRCGANEKQKEQKPSDLSEMMAHKEPYIAPVPTPMVADEQKSAEPSGKLSRKEYLYQLLIDQLITYSDYEYLTGKNPAWSEEDEEMINTLVSYVEDPSCWNLKCPKEKLVAFIESLPKRFSPQPKQDWSEEDERRRESCMFYLANARDRIEFNQYIEDNAKERGKKEIQKDMDWLKVLHLNFKKHNEAVAKLCSNEWNEEDERKLQKYKASVL